MNIPEISMKNNIIYTLVLSAIVAMFGGVSFVMAETPNGLDDAVVQPQQPVENSTASQNLNGLDDGVSTPVAPVELAPSDGGSSFNQNGADDVVPTPNKPADTDQDKGNGGSSSGGGSGSSSGSSPRYLTPVSVSVTGAVSCPLITDYLKIGGTNDQSQVTKLQVFLKNVEKLDVDVNGIFDTKTETAVKAFQTKYLSSVLGPWSATRATGFVYITTLKKINEIACATAFVLNADEQAIIDAYKQRGESTQPSIEVTPQTETPASTLEIGSNDNTDTSENLAAVGQSSVISRFWNFIVGLFR